MRRIETIVNTRYPSPARLSVPVAVISAALVMNRAMLELGFTPLDTVLAVFVTLGGAATVAACVTHPRRRLATIRTVIVILIVAVVVELLAVQTPLWTAIFTVLATGFIGAQAGLRAAGRPWRLPHLSFAAFGPLEA